MNIILHPRELRETRTSLSLSQSKISKATGITRSYLSEFESGKRLLDDIGLQAIKDFLIEEGGEFDTGIEVKINDKTNILNIKQLDGFMLPENHDEIFTESVLEALYENDKIAEDLLSREVEVDYFEEMSEHEFQAQEAIERMAICYLATRALHGKSKLAELLSCTDSQVTIGSHIRRNFKQFKDEELLL